MNPLMRPSEKGKTTEDAPSRLSHKECRIYASCPSSELLSLAGGTSQGEPGYRRRVNFGVLILICWTV